MRPNLTSNTSVMEQIKTNEPFVGQQQLSTLNRTLRWNPDNINVRYLQQLDVSFIMVKFEDADGVQHAILESLLFCRPPELVIPFRNNNKVKK